MKVQKALILAAGKGTRFLPYTQSAPKEMLAVCDKPVLQLLVEEIAQAGITDIMIVISPDKQSIVRYFTPDRQFMEMLRQTGKSQQADELQRIANLANVQFVYQPTVTGTAKAVQLAQEWAGDQPFVVLNGDDVVFSEVSATAQIVDAYERCNSTVLGVQAVSKKEICKYASCKVVETDGRLHKIDRIVEKPQTESEIYSLLAPLGRSVLTKDVFRFIDQTPQKQGETYLTDTLNIMAQLGLVYVYEFQGERFDFGDKLGYMEGFTKYALSHSELGPQYLEFLKKAIK